MFTKALVRPPGDSYIHGLTSGSLGTPSVDQALEQHTRYCEALASCGLNLVQLPSLEEFPDATFVEDTAVVTGKFAVITRPGAPSRAGETATIEAALAPLVPALVHIEAPGTVDGGDVCQIEKHFLIGISDRTNVEGARQLGQILANGGYSSAYVDIRGHSSLLHLKSGLSYLGEQIVVVTSGFADHEALGDFRKIVVADDEDYAANCVRVNDRVLVAAGFPKLAALLVAEGFDPLALDMSEFQKQDGGLSCLSLRF